MIRSWTAVILSVLLWTGTPVRCAPRPAGDEKGPTIQETMVLIPAGSTIEVKTKAKQKLRGRLGMLTRDAFELQTAQGEKLQTQSLRFDEVKSVKTLNDQGSTGRVVKHTLIGIAVVAVVITVVSLIIAAASNN
jgi:hypothetical protein